MTFLSRAPREVYRVYDEDEFFERAAADEPAAATASGAERRRRGGATTLLAAVGAVGGLIAIASLTTSGRSARGTGALLAAAGSSAASRLQSTHVWRQPADASGLRWRSAAIRPTPRAYGSRRGRTRARGAIAARSHDVVARVRVAIRAAALQSSQAAAEPDRVAVTANALVGRDASPSRSGAPEFGFER